MRKNIHKYLITNIICNIRPLHCSLISTGKSVEREDVIVSPRGVCDGLDDTQLSLCTLNSSISQ